MKPTKITQILDLALAARREGELVNPLFTGEAGLGKSQIIQQWVETQQKRNPDFFFVDLRLAFMEAPDLIGFPKEVKVIIEGGGSDKEKALEIWKTIHCIPEFWPLASEDPEREGLILLEEPNRATTGVMNCLMQLLTDKKVHLHAIPKNVVIAGAINPDSAEYDVNAMDTALKDRFEEYVVEYDQTSFVNYMAAKKWPDEIRRFVGQVWLYKTSQHIKDGGKYISPRTWSKMKATIVGLKSSYLAHFSDHEKKAIHWDACLSILGKDIGKEFYSFCYNQAPVTAQDLLKSKKKSIERLEKQSDPTTYAGELIASTVESIVENYGGQKANKDQISEDVMAEVALVIPGDQAINLLKNCGLKDSDGEITHYFRDFVKRHPELKTVLKANIHLMKAVNK